MLAATSRSLLALVVVLLCLPLQANEAQATGFKPTRRTRAPNNRAFATSRGSRGGPRLGRTSTPQRSNRGRRSSSSGKSRDVRWAEAQLAVGKSLVDQTTPMGLRNPPPKTRTIFPMGIPVTVPVKKERKLGAIL